MFTSRPQNTSILAGRDARIECVADGKPKPDIYWTFENHPVSTDRIDEGPASSSVTQTKSTLTLSRVRPSQSGVYVCKAISSIGKIYAKAELYVQVPAVIDEPPRSRVRVRPGNGATLHCGASGRPKPLVLWMHEEERTFLSPGDRTDTIEVSNDEDQLIIRAAYEEMNFVCVAANAVGADIARIKLIVSEGGENEIIEEAPEVGVISATGDNSLSSVRRMPIKGGIRMTNVTGVSPSSIRISWMLEMAEDVQRIDGFYILYRRADGRADGGLVSVYGRRKLRLWLFISTLFPITGVGLRVHFHYGAPRGGYFVRGEQTSTVHEIRFSGHPVPKRPIRTTFRVAHGFYQRDQAHSRPDPLGMVPA